MGSDRSPAEGGATGRDNRNWGLGPGARRRLGTNVTVGRLRAELSRGELGSRGAISTARLAQIEEGRSAATLDVWVRIAGTLGGSLDDLLEGVAWVPSKAEVEGEGSYAVRRGAGPGGSTDPRDPGGKRAAGLEPATSRA